MYLIILFRHDLALEHAMSAVIMLQEQMLLHDSSPEEEENEGEEKKVEDKYAVLAIAYHNMGVEQEFLHRVFSNLKLHVHSMTLLLFPIEKL
jgi:hypothetical protein